MNKFLTKQVIYASKIERFIDFTNVDCGICRIILTSESKDLYFYNHIFMLFIVKK